jgi:Serine carboxypeptidase S28
MKNKQQHPTMKTTGTNYGSIDRIPAFVGEDVGDHSPSHPRNLKARTTGLALSLGIALLAIPYLGSVFSSSSSSSVRPHNKSIADSKLETRQALHPTVEPRDPKIPFFFDQQVIDHELGPDASGTWSQRYYENSNYWRGPGHPIFVIFGGEGTLQKILYPFVSRILAERFGAVTLNPEHR